MENSGVGQSFSSYVPDLSQLARLQRSTLREGRAEGVDTVEITTGSGFQFTVLPGRGLDISHASYRGIPLCWRAFAGEVAAPYYEPEGWDWQRTAFGGLDEHGRAVLDGVASVDGGEGARAFTVASATSRQATSGRMRRWEGDDYRLWVRGKVAEAEALGTNLVLTREISTELGASHLTIRDHVENRTFARAEHMMLYHFNHWLSRCFRETARLLVNSEQHRAARRQFARRAGSLGSLRAAAGRPTASAFLSQAPTGRRLAKRMSCWRGCRIMPMGHSRSICPTPTRRCPGSSTGSA